MWLSPSVGGKPCHPPWKATFFSSLVSLTFNRRAVSRWRFQWFCMADVKQKIWIILGGLRAALVSTFGQCKPRCLHFWRTLQISWICQIMALFHVLCFGDRGPVLSNPPPQWRQSWQDRCDWRSAANTLGQRELFKGNIILKKGYLSKRGTENQRKRSPAKPRHYRETTLIWKMSKSVHSSSLMRRWNMQNSQWVWQLCAMWVCVSLWHLRPSSLVYSFKHTIWVKHSIFWIMEG